MYRRLELVRATENYKKKHAGERFDLTGVSMRRPQSFCNRLCFPSSHPFFIREFW